MPLKNQVLKLTFSYATQSQILWNVYLLERALFMFSPHSSELWNSVYISGTTFKEYFYSWIFVELLFCGQIDPRTLNHHEIRNCTETLSRKIWSTNLSSYQMGVEPKTTKVYAHRYKCVHSNNLYLFYLKWCFNSFSVTPCTFLSLRQTNMLYVMFDQMLFFFFTWA